MVLDSFETNTYAKITPRNLVSTLSWWATGGRYGPTTEMHMFKQTEQTVRVISTLSNLMMASFNV